MPSTEQPTGVATHVRTTLVLSSVQTLRAHGHFDAYAAALTPDARDIILSGVASGWFPMAIAEAHYRACNALGLTLNEQVALGAAVGDRVQGGFLKVLLLTAKELGVTPWVPLSSIDRIWERVFMGGGGAVVAKVGPKEATCRFVGLPVVDIPYLRNAWRGAFLAGMAPFCRKAYVQETTERRAPATAHYRLSWA